MSESQGWQIWGDHWDLQEEDGRDGRPEQTDQIFGGKNWLQTDSLN